MFATGLSLIALGCLSGATPRGQTWTSAVMLLHGRSGLRARPMAVLETLRAPSLCRHVHRELWRSVWLDLPSIIAATTCHQSNDAERYSRSYAFTGGGSWRGLASSPYSFEEFVPRRLTEETLHRREPG